MFLHHRCPSPSPLSHIQPVTDVLDCIKGSIKLFFTFSPAGMERDKFVLKFQGDGIENCWFAHLALKYIIRLTHSPETRNYYTKILYSLDKESIISRQYRTWEFSIWFSRMSHEDFGDEFQYFLSVKYKLKISTNWFTNKRFESKYNKIKSNVISWSS